MTTSHQDDFEQMFTDAVDRTHQMSTDGAAPSDRVWKSIQSQLPPPTQRAETADPREVGPDPTPVSRRTQRKRKEAGVDVALDAQVATSYGRFGRRSFTWATVTLVATIVVTSLLWHGRTPPGENDNDLAWAPIPAMVQSTPTSKVAESSCSVEPLTTDQVLETVLNPNKGYRRLGSTQAPNSDSLWEPVPILGPEYWVESELLTVADKDRASILRDMGVNYISCLQNGTAYQVWGILDPIVVQQLIIQEFPVIRTEEDIRAHIESVGPQPFIESGTSDLVSALRFNDSRELGVLETDDALRFTEVNETPLPPYGAGIILVGSTDSSFVFALYLNEVSPDVWVINDFSVTPGEESPGE